MRRCVWLALVLMCWGCEKKEAPGEDFASTGGVAAPESLPQETPGAKTPAKLEPPVFGSVTTQPIGQPKDTAVTLPAPEVVRAWFVEALQADKGVVWDPKASDARELRVAYLADTMMVQGAKFEGLQLKIVIAHRGQMAGQYESTVMRALKEGGRVGDSLEVTGRELARDVALDAGLTAKTLEEVRALMGAPAFLPKYAAESALGRLLKDTSFEDEALVTRYLGHPSERVVVQAAAWLVRRKAKVGPQLVAAAERLSRESKFVGLQALIFQLGSVSDETVRAYLGAVASGHENPAIQQAAAQALGGK